MTDEQTGGKIRAMFVVPATSDICVTLYRRLIRMRMCVQGVTPVLPIFREGLLSGGNGLHTHTRACVLDVAVALSATLHNRTRKH